MSQLITITEKLVGQKTIAAVSARELHERLGLKKQFTTWILSYTESDDWHNDKDFKSFDLEVCDEYRGPSQKDYALSIEMAEHVAMMTRTAKGKEIRNYFRQARDERDAMKQDGMPQLHDPAMQMLMKMVIEYDAIKAIQRQQELALIETQRQAIEALSISQRAETKSDMALDEARRFTLEEFILSNGLGRQFPRSQWRSYAAWLKTFCLEHGLRCDKAPVYDQPWPREVAYPIQALAAWLRHEQRKLQQGHFGEDQGSQ